MRERRGFWSRLQLPLVILLALGIGFYIYRLNPHLFDNKTQQDGLNQEATETFWVQLGKDLQLESPEISVFSQGQTPSELRFERKYLRRNIIGLPAKATASSIDLKDDVLFQKTSTSVSAYSLKQGKPLWEIQLRIDDKVDYFIDNHANASLFTFANGKTYLFEKTTGNLQWFKYWPIQVSVAPIIQKGHAFIVGSKGNDHVVMAVNLTNGKTTATKNLGKSQIKKWVSVEGKIYAVSETNHVFSIGLIDQQLAVNPITDGIDDLISVDGHLFTIAGEKNLSKIQLETGKIVWTYELSGPLGGSFGIVPEFNYLAVATTNGYLHVVDLANGNGIWRYNTRNESKAYWSLGVRLDNSEITELELKWKYKGWSVWSPCMTDRICIFNPEDGQILRRIQVKGRLLSELAFKNKEFYALIDQVESSPFEGAKVFSGVQLARFISLTDFQKEAKEPATAN